MKKYLACILSLSLLFSCQQKPKFLNNKYEGFWMETQWTYDFKPNGNFTFTSIGHFGNVVDSGFYLVKDSLIFLNPNNDWHVFDGVLRTRLKIINQNCLRDFDNNYYCLNPDSLNQLIDKEIAFQNMVISIVDTLSVVVAEKERIASHYSDPSEIEIKIRYNGIIIIDGKEFHRFDLTSYNMVDDRDLTYLVFLVSKKPFKIFKHDLKGHELNLVYGRGKVNK